MAGEERDVEKLVREYAGQFRVYAQFAGALEDLGLQLMALRNIAAVDVQSRAKTVESVRAKFERHPNYESLADMKDLSGIRVVLHYRSEVDVVRELVKDAFDVVEEEVHGGAVESFGYQSLHIIVRLKSPRTKLPEWRAFTGLLAEIQVRTLLQHAWATISHQLDYKREAAIPERGRRRLFRAAALLETSDELFDEFRRDVGETRAGYAREVEQDQWERVPIDSDSLEAAWHRLPIRPAVASAVDAGFLPVDDEFVMEDLEELPPTRSALGLLAEIAAAARLETLGELAASIEAIPVEQGVLRRFAKRATEKGFIPYAVPVDVVIFFLALMRPGASYLLPDSYADELLEAIRELDSELRELREQVEE